MLSFTAFTSWMRGVPQWVWLALLAAFGVAMIRRDAYRDGHREAERDIINDIEEQTHDRLERARAARASVEHRASDSLNDSQLDELRKRRASDPNNRL